MEIWKSIKGFTNIYEVSNLGNVRSLDRINEKGSRYKGKLLKLHKNPKNGYLYTGLTIKGKSKTFPIHRLVIESFLGYSDLVCDHIDDNKCNNNLSNLRYITHRQNMSKFHRTYKKLPTGVIKSKNGYISSIRVRGNKKVTLGNFKTIESAENAYLSKLNELKNEKLL